MCRVLENEKLFKVNLCLKPAYEGWLKMEDMGKKENVNIHNRAHRWVKFLVHWIITLHLRSCVSQ